MSTINLYVNYRNPITNYNSNELIKICKSSPMIQNSDFQIIVVEQDETDTDYQMLLEHGFTFEDLPILLIDNTFYDYEKAMCLLVNVK